MADEAEQQRRWHEEIDEAHGVHGIVAQTVTTLSEVRAELRTPGRVVRLVPDGAGPYTLWVVRATAEESADGQVEWARVDDNPPPVALEVVAYKHRQNEPAAEWDVLHGLDDPAIVVMDEDGEEVTARVRHVEGEGRSVVRFNGPVAGRAQCVGVPIGGGVA